jgi:predicted nucleic acid-binding protein
MQVLVDTDILIAYTKGRDFGLNSILTKDPCICPVTVSEFLNDKFLNSEFKYKQSVEMLDNFRVLDINRSIGEIAGAILRKGECPHLGDSIIGATALFYNLSLFTNNKKHFKKITGIKFYR